MGNGTESDSEQSDEEVILRASQDSSNNNAVVQNRNRMVDDQPEMVISDGETGQQNMSEVNTSQECDFQVGAVGSLAHMNTNVVAMDPGYQTELINNTIQATMKQLMEQGRLVMEKETTSKKRTTFNKQPSKSVTMDKPVQCTDQRNVGQMTMGTQSEVTIYDNAVRNEVGKRNSSSSEEAIDTSDELIMGPSEQECEQMNQHTNLLNVTGGRGFTDVDTGEPRPSTAQAGGGTNLTPQERAAELIREAELNKAKLLDLQGKRQFSQLKFSSELLHSVVVDEKYKAVASHMDCTTHKKIEMGEYVDFAKLIPTD